MAIEIKEHILSELNSEVEQWFKEGDAIVGYIDDGYSGQRISVKECKGRLMAFIDDDSPESCGGYIKRYVYYNAKWCDISSFEPEFSLIELEGNLYCTEVDEFFGEISFRVHDVITRDIIVDVRLKSNEVFSKDKDLKAIEILQQLMLPKCRDCKGYYRTTQDLCSLAEKESVNDDADACEEFDGYYQNEEEYTPSASNGDYSPAAPWLVPGMRIEDFI